MAWKLEQELQVVYWNSVHSNKKTPGATNASRQNLKLNKRAFVLATQLHNRERGYNPIFLLIFL